MGRHLALQFLKHLFRLLIALEFFQQRHNPGCVRLLESNRCGKNARLPEGAQALDARQTGDILANLAFDLGSALLHQGTQLGGRQLAAKNGADLAQRKS